VIGIDAAVHLGPVEDVAAVGDYGGGVELAYPSGRNGHQFLDGASPVGGTFIRNYWRTRRGNREGTGAECTTTLESKQARTRAPDSCV
jgi:hypothetical protein